MWIGTGYMAILQGNNNGQNIFDALWEKDEALDVTEQAVTEIPFLLV